MTSEWLGKASLLIDGELTEAEDGARYPNVNPATEEVIGEGADASSVDMDRAIDAARRAFDESAWSTDVALRVRALRQLHDGLMKNADAFRALTVAETGLPTMYLNNVGFDGPVSGINWFAGLLEDYDFVEDHGVTEALGTASHRWVEREAIGVVGAITPWNMPTMVNVAKLAPALAAGNAVILKGAPDTPWCASALAKIIAEDTEIPPGIVNVITSSANERGQELVTDPRVDMITFTGSTATGRRIMTLGGETVKKCFLELGGKSANIVLEDADLTQGVAASAGMVLVHGGQGCSILTRLLLPRSRFEEGVDIARQIMSSTPYGDPSDPANVMGPLISERQRARVEGMVDRAKAGGATPLIGGQRPAQFERGYYYEPTLFVGLSEDDELVRDEIFGPVLVVLAFDDEDDAVRMANNTIYGLSSAVFSGDRDHSKAVARRLRAGTVVVDGGVYYNCDVPFGGYKQSGLGRENGRAGFEEYLEVKTLAEPA